MLKFEMEMEISITSHINPCGSYIHTLMNDMNDGPAQDSNPPPLAYKVNALPTELQGLADSLESLELHV